VHTNTSPVSPAPVPRGVNAPLLHVYTSGSASARAGRLVTRRTTPPVAAHVGVEGIRLKVEVSDLEVEAEARRSALRDDGAVVGTVPQVRIVVGRVEAWSSSADNGRVQNSPRRDGTP